MSRPRRPRGSRHGARTGTPLGPHLDEETLAELAGRGGGEAHPHVASCALCRARLALARDLLPVDGLAADAAAGARRSELERQLEAARDADRSPARLRVRLPSGGGLALEAEAAELFARAPAVALRRREAPPPLGCRRRFGDYELELELTAPSDGGAAAAASVDVRVRLLGPETERARAALLGAGRELSSQPLGPGRATFRNVPPGSYALDVYARRVVVGRVLLEISGDAP